MEHTKLPWHLQDRLTLRNNPCGIDVMGDDKRVCIMPDGATTGGGRAFPEQWNNAQFIVQACNSHYELIEACKRALSYCVANFENDNTDKDDPAVAIADALEQALKQAKGE